MKSAEVVYRIGEFEFISDRNLLIRNDEQQKLEQMQADILMIFIHQHKSIVTRELLEAEIWDNKITTEQAINNKISELRKLFKDDYRNPRYLKTHHKLGYELIADCEQLKERAEQKESIKHKPHQKINKKLWAFFAIAAILFTFIPVHILKSTNNTDFTVTNIVKLQPITSERGQEWAPNLSSDGKYLAYSHRLDNASNWKVVIKNLATDETNFITQGVNNSLSPVWAPNENTLYFIKNIDRKCTIWQVTQVFTNPQMDQLIECGDVPSMSPLAIDPTGEWLYFSHLDNQPKFIISRFNLLNHTTETLTAPPISRLGDYTLALSPNGKYLAFLRALTEIKPELMLLDIATRELSLIQEFNHNIFKLAWNDSNDEIAYIDDSNSLVTFNITTRETKSITTFQNKTLAPYFTNDNAIFVVDGGFFVSDIYSAKISEEGEELDEDVVISSSYHDYAPAFGNEEGTIAFTSNRNGISQIWIKKNKETRRLTKYQSFAYISDKHFSFNEASLLFLRDNVPFILDLHSRSISEPLVKFKHSASPIWACDGKSIFLSSEDNGAWNLYQIDLETLEVSKKLSHVTSIKSDCSNSSYYVMLESKKGLFKLENNGLSATEVLPNYHSAYSKDWQISNDHLFILNNAQLIKVNLYSGIESPVKVPAGNINSFRLFKNRIYFSRRFFKETHIKQLVKIPFKKSIKNV